MVNRVKVCCRLSSLYLTRINSSFFPSKNSSAHLGFRVNSVLTRNGCSKFYISLFKEIILQQLDELQTEIQGFLTKLCIQSVKGSPRKNCKITNNGTWS